MEKGLLRENFKLKKKKVITKVRNLETREKKERKNIKDNNTLGKGMNPIILPPAMGK